MSGSYVLLGNRDTNSRTKALFFKRVKELRNQETFLKDIKEKIIGLS